MTRLNEIEKSLNSLFDMKQFVINGDTITLKYSGKKNSKNLMLQIRRHFDIVDYGVFKMNCDVLGSVWVWDIIINKP